MGRLKSGVEVTQVHQLKCKTRTFRQMNQNRTRCVMMPVISVLGDRQEGHNQLEVSLVCIVNSKAM